MTRTYYALRYRLDKIDQYLIWFTDEASHNYEPDGVVAGEDGRVLVFRNQAEVAVFAADNQCSPIEIEADSPRHDLDLVSRWTRVKNRRKARHVDCQEVLTVWNLLADVSATVGGGFDPDHPRTRRVYEKLFWGNNLPSVTPVGRSYEPIWSWAEIKLLREVLRQGLMMFRERVTPGWLASKRIIP